MWRKITRWFTGFIVTGIIGIFTLAIILFLVIDTKNVTSFIENQVAAQTGGNLTIGKTNFSAFRGFTLTDIRFTPKSTATSQAREERELFFLREIKLHWNLWSLLYGSIAVDAALIKGGELRLSQKNGLWNFDTRTGDQQKAPAARLSETEDSQQREAASIDKIIETVASNFFVPIRLSISNVGIENLDVHITSDRASADFRNMYIKGLTTTIDLRTFGRNAKIALQSEVEQITNGSLTIPRLTATIEAQLKTIPSEKKISLTSLKINILDTLTSDLTASLASSRKSPKLLDFQLSENLRIKSMIPAALRNNLPRDLTSTGEISLDIPNISGTINVDDLTKEISLETIRQILPPRLAATLTVKDIMAKSPSMGIDTKPLNLTMHLNTTNEKNDSIGADLKIVGAFGGFSYADIHSPDKSIIKVENIGLNAIAHGNLNQKPSLEARIDISAGAAGFQSQKNDYIGVPIKVESQITAQNIFENIHAGISASGGELLSANAAIHCAKQCQDFKINANATIPSFAKIFEKVRSSVLGHLQPKYQPEQITGLAELNINIDGQSAGLAKQSPQELIKTIKWNSNLNAAITNLSLKIPANSLTVQNANLGLILTGDDKRQSLTITESFNSAASTIPSQNKKPQTIEVKNFNWATTVNSTIPPLYQLNRAAHLVRSNLKTNISIGSLTVSELLKKPLNGIQISANLSTRKNLNLALDTFKVLIPDLTTDIGISADASFADDFSPEKFQVRFDGELKEIPTEYLSDVRASGGLGAHVTIVSEDMTFAEIRGAANIKELNLVIPNSDPSKPAALQIDRMTGSIPIRHKFPIRLLSSQETADSTPKRVTVNTDDLRFSGVVDVNDEQIRESAEKYLEKIKPPVVGDTRLAISEDFGNFSDFYPGRQPLTVKRLIVRGLTLDQLEIDAELAQNELAINNFIAGFIGGKIQGDLRLAFDDKPESIKTSLHVTRLNTENLLREIPRLKRKARGLFGGQNPFLDGALHLQYDVRSGDIMGGLHITSIGKDQLRMIMYYLDPTDSDSSISAIKTALNFGEIRLVSVPIKNGEIGVDVDVRVSSIPIPTPKIQGFPIAKLITNIQKQGEEQDESFH